MRILHKISRLVGILAFAGASSPSAASIDWVTLGDPGNAADTTGFGSVAFDSALRFANWLHNGQPTGLQTSATTENWGRTFDWGRTFAERALVVRARIRSGG
jgi:hypothetical protein